MKLYWHKRRNNPRLLLIFNGWGFDERVLCGFDAPAQSDVLLVSDYTLLEPEKLADAHDYAAVDLIAWSFGVFAAQHCTGALPQPQRCLAVNGTLEPISDRYGIPRQVFDATLQTYSDATRRKFQLRVAGGAKAYEAMQAQLPWRDTADQLEELKALARHADTPSMHELDWSGAIVADADRIFPPENMRVAWGALAKPVEGAHYIDFNRVVRDWP